MRIAAAVLALTALPAVLGDHLMAYTELKDSAGSLKGMFALNNIRNDGLYTANIFTGAIAATKVTLNSGSDVITICDSQSSCAGYNGETTTQKSKFDLTKINDKTFKSYEVRVSTSSGADALKGTLTGAGGSVLATYMKKDKGQTFTGSGVAIVSVANNKVSWTAFTTSIAGADNEVTAMHIHNDAGDPLVVMFDKATNVNSLNPTTGTVDLPANWNQAAFDAAKYYVNVHTTAQPAGAYKGFIRAVNAFPSDNRIQAWATLKAPGGAVNGLVGMHIASDGSVTMTMNAATNVGADKVVLKRDGTEVATLCSSTTTCATSRYATGIKIDLSKFTKADASKYTVSATKTGTEKASGSVQSNAATGNYFTYLSGDGGSGIGALTITGSNLAWTIFMDPVSGTDNQPTAAHIHTDIGGGVLVNLGDTSSLPANQKPNIGSVAVPADWNTAQLDNGDYYFNVHSTKNAASAFRGNLFAATDIPSASGSSSSPASALAPGFLAVLFAAALALFM